MSEAQHTYATARRTVVELVFGSMAAQVAGAVVRLGVADAVADGEPTADEIAATCGTPARTTRRLLRAAVVLGLAEERGADRFALTPAGALLRSTGPGSLNAFTRMFTDPVMVRAWHDLSEAVRDERTTFDTAFGQPFFDHLKTVPELAAGFNAAMSQGARLVAGLLPDAYDFGRFTSITDVGGGDGTLLTAVLRRYEGLRGVVFDTADGSAQAGAKLAASGVAERCTVSVGDFFAAGPDPTDAVLLKSILHDWDDERCTTILTHCRRALPPDGRLLVVEPVLPGAAADATTPVSYLSDLNMLVNVGGQERTRAEFEALLTGAGFTVAEFVPLPPSEFHLIEAVPTA
ncbi:methyltransferase [Actinosynnema sp. NPDC050436]|uniref:methyltransferase n=1 Tax=Actinosynnema sp. NPDC050436 TaxID=3155659 RepID=UPI0033F913D0